MTKLNPNAPLTSDTLELLKSEQVSEEELHEFFLAHPEEPVLDAWLLSSLYPLTPASQLRLRIARMAFSYWTDLDERQELLFGVPLAVQAGDAHALDWRQLKDEYEHGLAHALAHLQARVTLTPLPVVADEVHQIGASRLAGYCELLLMDREPVSKSTRPLAGAAVWIGLVSVPLQFRKQLRNLMFRVNPRLSKLVSSLNVRLEALAETKEMHVRVFPPTAFWNAGSLARLVDARLKLQPLKKSGRTFSVKRVGQEAVVQENQHEVLRLSFPEELDSDIAPLFHGWAEFKPGGSVALP